MGVFNEQASWRAGDAGNYVYKNGELEFFNQPEGYVEKDDTGYKYVYQFKDHLQNIRISYTDINNDGNIVQSEIVEEKNYYPFGLTHKGYNNVVNGSRYNYQTFQGQELAENLGLNLLEFKWRIHDPMIGRFISVDPLAEEFVYNSPYAFSENKVISHFELEGLEAVLAITMGNDVRYRGDILMEANPNLHHKNLQSGGINSFVNAFKSASDSDSEGIGFVVIWGHGTPGSIWGSDSTGNTDISTSNLEAFNDSIKNGEISFADNSIIYIGNCNSGTCGYGDTKSFAAELSKITGTTVIGGDNSVGLGVDGNQIENKASMIYWMYNPSKDSFLSFENGIEVDNLGGSIDVVQLMNAALRMTNPVSTVSTLTPSGIVLFDSEQQMNSDVWK